MSFNSRIPGTRAWRTRRAHVLCVQVSTHIDEIVDGELPPSRKAKLLESHLASCEYCRRKAEGIRQLKQHIARVGQTCDQETVDRLHNLARRLCSGEDCDVR